MRVGTYIGIIGKRIQRQFCQKFRVLDILEIMFSQGAVCVSALEQDMRPVGGAGIFKEQEGLCKFRYSVSIPRKLSILVTPTRDALPSSRQIGIRRHRGFRAR